MSAPGSILDDVNALHAAPPAERRRAAAALAEALGAHWKAEALEAAEDSLPFVHRPTGIRFVAVPGGRCEVGISDADLEKAAEHVDWTGVVAGMAERLAHAARPVHTVEVRPFLCARSLLDGKQVKKLTRGATDFDAFRRADARALARSLGLRLPAEAELEWLLRDGGTSAFALDADSPTPRRSRFGVDKLFPGQWAEDDWHDTYAGAPARSLPWMDGDPCGVYRGGQYPEEMQSRDELLFMLAGARGHGKHPPSFVGVRLAADVPT